MLEYRFDRSYLSDVDIEYLSFSRLEATFPCPNLPLLYSLSAKILKTSLYLSDIVMRGAVESAVAPSHDDLPRLPLSNL